MKEEPSYPFYARLAFVLVSIIALGYLSVLGQSILAPLFLGLLFAILLMPLASFFEKKFRFPRMLASLVSVLILVGGIGTLIYIIGSQFSFLVSEWPHLKVQLTNSFNEFQKWIAHTFHIKATKQLTYLNQLSTNALSISTTLLGAVFIGSFSLILFFVFTLLYTFFILFHRKRIIDFLIASFHEEHSSIIYSIVDKVQYMIKKYVAGLFIEMAVVSVISGILFWILGSHFVVLLGLITGVFNIIPYIGILTAALVGALITFATETPAKSLFVLLAVILVHELDSNILMPQILGSKVRINALVIILGVIIGEMLWGIAGMFVAIPAIAILKIIFDHVTSLNSWAILLGDEERIDPKPNSKISRLLNKLGGRFTGPFSKTPTPESPIKPDSTISTENI